MKTSRELKEKLEKQGREREDLAQRTRDGLRKAEEKETGGEKS